MNQENYKSKLLETIKYKDGQFFNLQYHQARFDLARKSYLGYTEKIILKDKLVAPDECKTGLYRCRVIYSRKIEKVEYIPHQIRKIRSLKLVHDNEIDYQFKYTDRIKLSSLFERREDCDDILIIKNGFVTDSSMANTIFFDGIQWWTPDTPLLPGIQRAKLISEGKIKVCSITANDLPKYRSVGLINALQDFKDMQLIDIKNIKC